MILNKHLQESLKKTQVLRLYNIETVIYGPLKISVPKEPSIVIPKPKLCYLDENKFKGMPMSYEEDIPFWGENSDKKWNYVKKYFTENKESYIAISHDVNSSARKKSEN